MFGHIQLGSHDLGTNNVFERFLRNYNQFVGCLQYDRLPPFPTEFPRTTMIINTDDSSKPGQHCFGLVMCLKINAFIFIHLELEL